MQGKFRDDLLSVSHRWMQGDEPDPDGEQLKAIQEFLREDPKGKEIKYVWMDSVSMPQDQPKGTIKDADKVAFKTMLAEVCAVCACNGTSVPWD